ncbi:hypothetical protein CK203_050611 [Vitis vinifera]|uniref:Glycoside hydrolase family 5 domain-containing protein n=1 Tax=Vitis vinifera TaxID=29760 RepID=A0A438GK64_VITVI|nr:hypothetical protein CK203_050611 [Vitis vinifera]
MGKFFFCFFFSFLSILPLPLLKPVVALPLYTNSRWIVDEDGARVKLACVNWPSHLEAVVAEGLSKQPVAMISKKIGSMGFNCVRLTWPLFLATNQSLASLTVRQSFQRLGLLESIAGFQANNPSMVDLPLISAYQVRHHTGMMAPFYTNNYALKRGHMPRTVQGIDKIGVVSGLADNNVMVILDNHLSKPGWCCSSFDGNGFFGDQYFNPDLWVQGLTRMATMFRGVTNVVGMSLRNELRGPKQNVKDWYRYMQKGAEAVHSANPDVLVIVSGLSYEHRPIVRPEARVGTDVHREISVRDALVWIHGWERLGNRQPQPVCGRVVESVMRRGGVLLEKGWPLFVSEFGVDQRGTNVNDNRYLNCFFGLAAELDFDWHYGHCPELKLLAEDFCPAVSFSRYCGPDLSDARPHKSDAWSYTPQKTLIMKETYFCLQADGPGNPGKLVCLDIDSSNNIVTNACKCLSGDNSVTLGASGSRLSTPQIYSTRPLIQISSNLDLNGAEHAS